MRLRVRIEPNGTATSGDMFSAKWRVANQGARAVDVSNVSFQLHTTKQFARYVRELGFVFGGTLVMDHYPPGLRPQDVIQSNAYKDYGLTMTPMQVRMLIKQANAPCPDGWSPDWVVPVLRCTITGPDGTSKTFTEALPLVGTIDAYKAELTE